MTPTRHMFANQSSGRKNDQFLSAPKCSGHSICGTDNRLADFRFYIGVEVSDLGVRESFDFRHGLILAVCTAAELFLEMP